jgi:hypothetical protein
MTRGAAPRITSRPARAGATPSYVRTKLVDQAARQLTRAVTARLKQDEHEASLACEQICIIAAVFDHIAFGEMVIGRTALLLSDSRVSPMLPREFADTEDYVRSKIFQLLPELLSDIRVGPEHEGGHA